MKQLFKDRSRVKKLEQSLGLSHLSEPVKSVYAFIAYEPTTRSVIMRSDFCKDLSLSTIKRAVDQLIAEGLVKVFKDEIDARKRLLFATGTGA
jgi:DNA-binding MarR family transcriptional regulator